MERIPGLQGQEFKAPIRLRGDQLLLFYLKVAIWVIGVAMSLPVAVSPSLPPVPG